MYLHGFHYILWTNQCSVNLLQDLIWTDITRPSYRPTRAGEPHQKEVHVSLEFLLTLVKDTSCLLLMFNSPLQLLPGLEEAVNARMS